LRKSFLKHIYDFIGAPLRLVLLPDETCEKLGLTSLGQERFNTVLPCIEGRLLDLACGDNRLVKMYGNGVGVDVYDWGGGAVIIENAGKMPFEDRSFDTVSILAALNHIPERKEAVKEIHRVLKVNGKVVVTMINPVLGEIGHKIWWYSEDKKRGMKEGENSGLWNSYVIKLFEDRGFRLQTHKKFVYFMNNLFVFRKKDV